MRLLILFLALTTGISLGTIAVCIPAEGKAIVPLLFKASETRPGEHMVVADMVLGKPPRKMRFEVRFDVSDFVVYGDQSVHSARHVPVGHTSYGTLGVDSVFFGATEKRTHIVDNTGGGHPLLSYPRLCASCDGIFGLHSDAEVWRWWPSASMTSGAITFGDKIEVLTDDKDVVTFSCASPMLVSAARAGICMVNAKCRDRSMRALIDPASPYVSLPQAVRDSYLHGKNIYVHEFAKEWDPLTVDLLADEISIPLNLRHDDLTGQHKSEARELLIKTSESNDTMTIGSAILWNYAVYLDKASGTMTVRKHAVLEHLPAVFAILYIISVGFLLRYKMVSSVRHYDRLPRDSSIETISIIYEVVGWIIPVVLLALPETRNVMIPDYTALYGVTAAIVAVGIAVGIAVRIYVGYMQRERKRAVTTTMFCALLAESLWYESVLFVALWLAVVPRRREGIASALTAFAAAWALYTLVTYLFYWSTYVGCQFGLRPRSGKSRSGVKRVQPAPVWLSGAVGLSILSLLAYFSIMFVVLFMNPLLERVGTIYADLALGTTLVISAILVVGGVFIASAHITRAVGIYVRARLEVLVPP